MLDWELVHIGEAYEDLAWFCIRAWRFGAPEHLGAGGLGSVESFLSAYEAAAGTTVDREAFRWWLILATLRWGVICRYQAERHLSGQTPSVELAAIGRRVCETEWDLLDLLDGEWAEVTTRCMDGRPRPNSSPRSPTSSTPTCGPPGHGAPTSAMSSTPASPRTCCAFPSDLLSRAPLAVPPLVAPDPVFSSSAR